MQDKKIILKNITKIYKVYNSPNDRIKESFGKKKLHREFYALNDISFSLEKGSILGIMGKNGAGKSTLLKIITGVLSPTSGDLKVQGKISSLLELGTGFNMEYSGLENIYFYGTLMGYSKKEMEQKISQIIEFAEIEEFINQPVKTYSSGMFARLAFSCAINVEPDILIVDEILSVGDLRFQAKCFNKFKEFKKKGVTILYVGHDISLMRTFCDKAIWLHDGQLIEMGDPMYISSKFTEFMYAGETKEFIENNLEDGNGLKDNSQEKLTRRVDTISKDKDKVIAHWGPLMGSIIEVKLKNHQDREINYFTPNEDIKIEIVFLKNDLFDYRNLSLAFSIKNNEGIDLIVGSTFDQNIIFSEKEDLYKVQFELKTYLQKGEYYLVAALENRKNAAISYYEYIEGVKYFKVFCSEEYFGSFLPPIKISNL